VPRRQYPPREALSQVVGPLVPGIPVPPLEPPPELSESEQTVWRRIVASQAPGWFNDGNAPILRELCRHSEQANRIVADLAALEKASEIAIDRTTVDPVKLELMIEVQRTRTALVKLHLQVSRQIGDCATRLRLTNQSRYDQQKAKVSEQDVSSPIPEPWNDWGRQRDRGDEEATRQ
jgi:hypothetical protein